LESSDALASFCGIQEIMERKVLTPEQIYDKINKVTAADVLKISRDIFKPQKLNLALIGPFTPLEITRLWKKTIKRINF